MRKIAPFLLAFAAFSTASAQKQETIEGNGNKVTREVPVSSFDALRASGVYELRIAQGDKESVKIEADENLQEYVNVKNDGSRLVIDMEKLKHKNFKSKTKMKVYVTFKKLKELDLRMVGNVASDEALTFDDLEFHNKSVGNVELKLTANKLEIHNKSVGNLELSGKADEAKVHHNGVGNFEAGNLKVQNMNIDNTGVGNAEVFAEKSLKVKDSFLGKVHNKGAAPVRKINKVRV